jgi:Xaa-Pro aminopeptidase
MAIPDFYDCDDFAWRFKADMRWWFNCTAVGFVFDKSSWHAYNIIVFDNGEAALFEPQQDKFVALNEPIVIEGQIIPQGSTGLYSLTEGLILI